MIDMVVARVSETPTWEKTPHASAARVISEFKAVYEKTPAQMYSSTQAIALMELTGRRLGEEIEVHPEHARQVCPAKRGD